MGQIIELMKAIPWWPLTVLVLAVVFRYELRGILDRLLQLKYKGVELTFKEGLRQAEKGASELPQTKAAEILSKPAPGATRYEEAMRVAKLSPRAAIEIVWQEVESAIREAARKHGVVADTNVPLSKTISDLISKKLIPEGFQKVFEQLQSLRDQALHAPGFVLGLDETERFIQLARAMTLSLGNLLSAKPVPNKAP